MTDVRLVTKIFVGSYKYIQIISGCVKPEKSCVFLKNIQLVLYTIYSKQVIFSKAITSCMKGIRVIPCRKTPKKKKKKMFPEKFLN